MHPPIPVRTSVVSAAAIALLALTCTAQLRAQEKSEKQPVYLALQTALERQRESVRGQREQLARMSDVRRLMTASIERQRESARRQVVSTRPPVVDPLPVEGWAAQQPCAPIPFLEIQPYINQVARREGLSPELINAVIGRESSFHPCAVSRKGALGMMQLMPETAAELGVKNPFDPRENIDGGARYLNELLKRFGGDVVLALAGYNAGPSRVILYQGVPPFAETRDYVSDIIEKLQLPVTIEFDD